MVCKCGAMVKARVRSAEITGIGRWQGQNGVRGRILAPQQGECLGARAGRTWSRRGRPVQELGTIEAGSKGVTTASDDAGRSPPRSNSVRRSKALERKN